MPLLFVSAGKTWEGASPFDIPSTSYPLPPQACTAEKNHFFERKDFMKKKTLSLALALAVCAGTRWLLMGL